MKKKSARKKKAAGKRAKSRKTPARRAAKPRVSASKKTTRAPRRPARAASRRKTAKKKKPAATAQETHPRPTVIAPANGVLLGYVDDYFAKIGVVALTLDAALSVGAKIQILGHTTNFEQTVDSMQIDHQPVPQARPKDAVGIKVLNRARRGDHVYLLP